MKKKEKTISRSARQFQQRIKTNPSELDPKMPPEDEKQKSGRDTKTGRFLPGHKFSSAPTKWTEEKAMELAEGLLEWMKSNPAHFMVKDYLFQNDLYSDVVSYLSDKYPQFSDYIGRAMEIQAHRIQQYALVNKINSGMAQWVLSVVHKQSAVQKQEISGPGGGPVMPPAITIQPVAVQGKEDASEDEEGDGGE